MKIFDEIASLERALDVRGRRHTVLAGNLANADTPGFAPLDVDFDAAMAATEAAATEAAATEAAATERATSGTAVSGAAERGFDATAAAIGTAEELAGRAGLDGNTVDVDKTMIALAENGMQYGAAARAAGKKLNILRYVASDGLG